MTGCLLLLFNTFAYWATTSGAVEVADADEEFSIKSFLEGTSTWNLSAPYFGAKPPKKPLSLHRRGWESCFRCGGAERLGASLPLEVPLDQITKAQAEEIIDAVRAHGIVVIPGQNLTRAQQVEFTSRLGETVVLPSSFEGKDPEPFHPAIQVRTPLRFASYYYGISLSYLLH